MTRNEYQTCMGWIAANIRESPHENRYQTSYFLKHCLERDTGIYTDNETFKAMMVDAGHKPVDESKRNATYKIKRVPIEAKILIQEGGAAYGR